MRLTAKIAKRTIASTTVNIKSTFVRRSWNFAERMSRITEITYVSRADVILIRLKPTITHAEQQKDPVVGLPQENGLP